MNSKAKPRTHRAIAHTVRIGILLTLISRAGSRRSLGAILRTSHCWIAASVIVHATSWIPRTWRFQRLTPHVGKTTKIFDLLRLRISGYASNAMLPATLGDAATVGYPKTRGIDIGRPDSITRGTRMLDVMTFILSIRTIIRPVL